MTKGFSKLVSVVMALCFFMGAFPVSASAEEYELSSPETYWVTELSPNAQMLPPCGETAYSFYSTGAEVDATRYFYNQLTANQKEIYDQVKAAGAVQNITMDMSNINIVGSGSSSSAAASAMSTQITADVKMALSALNEDYPLFFWMHGFSWSNARYSLSSSGTTYKATLSSLTVVVNISSTHFSDYDDVAAKYNAVIEKFNSIKINGISRHEKLKSIHDYITENIEYDTTISQSNIFDVYGALVNGICVCEGYAELFKLFCDREGIPCLTVIGTGNGGAHKWNYIQMEDGEWYLLDATWDDQGTIYYSYFLIGSNTKAPYLFETVADSTIHIPTGLLFSSGTPLTYPTLSEDTYSVGVLHYGAPDINVDKSRGVILVGKGITSYLTYFVSNTTTGHTRSKTGNGVTGTSLTLGDGVSTATYLVAMRGDVNITNTVTVDDYTLLADICFTKSTITEGSAEFYAGDMTQDGAVDGFDAIALELYQNDMLEFD